MVTLSKLIEQTKEEMKRLNYSEKTQRRRCCVWNQFQIYSNAHNVNTYDDTTARRFLEEHYKIDFNVTLTKNHVYLLRGITMLKEIEANSKFKRGHQLERYTVPSEYSSLFKNYIQHEQQLNLSTSTLRTKGLYVKRFLIFLVSKKIYNTVNISNDEITEFMSTLSTYASQTKSAVLFALRSFFNYLNANNLSEYSGYHLLPIIFTNKKDKILSYYSIEDVKLILENVDTTTSIGKRDYLILILAIQLGIRASDIRKLTFENIDWNTNTLSFKQQKTNTWVKLPMLDNIKYAIIDYLKNSRPTSNSNNIFVRFRAPYEEYVNTNPFWYVINRYINLANINTSNKKRGLHSMRHSLASNLLSQNTPMPVITGILGHNSVNTTSIYLRIDIEKLRNLGLEVPCEANV